MKSTALRFACISLILLFATAPAHAVERKSVFNTESLKYESGTGAERCRAKCGRWSGPDVKSLHSEGWKIISSFPKEVIAEQYWFTPCNTCRPHGCVCIGTEYVLQRDETALKAEAGSTVHDDSAKDTRTALLPARSEALKNELDLLKKEIDSLKQENTLLKQEIEALRTQLKLTPE